MSKVILIIDKPNACVDCPFHFEAEKISTGVFQYKLLFACRYAPSDVEDFYLENIMDEKPDWCPLRDVPDKYSPVSMNFERGWNACIDEILKEDD